MLTRGINPLPGGSGFGTPHENFREALVLALALVLVQALTRASAMTLVQVSVNALV
jgi:hypothetical protein